MWCMAVMWLQGEENLAVLLCGGMVKFVKTMKTTNRALMRKDIREQLRPQFLAEAEQLIQQLRDACAPHADSAQEELSRFCALKRDGDVNIGTYMNFQAAKETVLRAIEGQVRCRRHSRIQLVGGLCMLPITWCAYCASYHCAYAHCACHNIVMP